MSPKVGNAGLLKAAQNHEKFLAAVRELYTTEANYVQLLQFAKEVYRAASAEILVQLYMYCPSFLFANAPDFEAFVPARLLKSMKTLSCEEEATQHTIYKISKPKTPELNSFEFAALQNFLEVLSKDITSKKDPIVDRETVKTLFNNLGVFVSAHAELLANFETMMATLSADTCVSKHFGSVCISYI